MEQMPDPPFPVWQGFRHAWTYNHRLNRLGDWVQATDRDGDTLDIEVGHSAASGIGPDEVTFFSLRTVARARGVFYKEFKRTIRITSKEQASQVFLREIRVGANDGIPEDCDRFVAILQGFDLYSEKDADKLVSIHLATSPAVRDPRTGEVVFLVTGALNVDCDSAECDNYEDTGTMIGAILAAATLPSNMGPFGALTGAVFGALFSKLNITTDYTLDIRFALIAGYQADFAVSLHKKSHTFDWDKKDVITRKNDGTVVGFEMQGDPDPRWSVAVPAITLLSLEVTRERWLLEPDTAMHLLEWDMAVWPTEVSGTHCVADLELFFRNWQVEKSQYLDDFIDPTDDIDALDDLLEGIFSHRDAGAAKATIGLALMQFAEAETSGQEKWKNSLFWGGEGVSANTDDAVRRLKPEPHYKIALPSQTGAEILSDRSAVWIAAEHVI